ncbi:MAG TPA: DUF4147 domain-containing protein [Gammaproteobacteria bacterium]|nr:DUF4147 domain-containing protein [Gammaproteobacteria bacterium]
MQDRQRTQLLEIYQAAIDRVNGRVCVAKYLQGLSQTRPVRVISIGKAASSMMLGVLEQWDACVQKGLIITKYNHLLPALQQDRRIKCLQASHPVPDESSLEAGSRLLQFLEEVPVDVDILFLISGGASSLVEVLPEGIHLHDLQALTSALLGNGFSIDRINHIRKRISCIKGGKLLEYCRHRNVQSLMISDVPGDDVSVIGSGLLVPEQYDPSVDQSIPEWFMKGCGHRLPVTEISYDGVVPDNIIVASNDMAIKAISSLDGLPVNKTGKLTGDINEMSAEVIGVLINGGPGVYLWGGECTVRLPETPGKGGRCQHMALIIAQAIAGSDNITVLVMATDGSDGPGEEGGALIDGATVFRGEQQGYDVNRCLNNADAGSFLYASADLVQTGPTGTNVMDLLIAVKT